MSKWTLFLSCLATLVIAVGLSGCADSTVESPDSGDHSHGAEDADHDHDADADHTHDEDADHDADADADHDEHAGHTPESSDVPEGLAALSPEDREAAIKQVICPVSGGKLGGMGAPVKVDVKGRAVFICCEGCREELLKDPDKYLATLGQ